MIELWVPDIEPENDTMLQQLRQRCSIEPEIPAETLLWIFEDVLHGKTARAKRLLKEWAESIGKTASGIDRAPLLWALYEDGWRYAGMPNSEPARALDDITIFAHYDARILIDFTGNVENGSWQGFRSIVNIDPYLMRELKSRCA